MGKKKYCDTKFKLEKEIDGVSKGKPQDFCQETCNPTLCTPSPTDDDCKDIDDEIELTKEGTTKCRKIGKKGWCGEKVKDEGDKTAAKFCTICGCGVNPVPVPTPSPTDDDCKDIDDEIELTEEGTTKCRKIDKKGWCGEKVNDEGDKTAAKFCTICGCGVDPVPSPTPSPPDDDCKDNND